MATFIFNLMVFTFSCEMLHILAADFQGLVFGC